MTENWQANPAIAFESFGEETVLIDIEKGLYFSLRGSAAAMWSALQTQTLSEQGLLGMFGQRSAEEHQSLLEALHDLVEHGLILPSTAPAIEVSGLAFAHPSVEVFSDLAELITIDPVHDVQAAGWPEKRDPRPDTTPSL